MELNEIRKKILNLNEWHMMKMSILSIFWKKDSFLRYVVLKNNMSLWISDNHGIITAQVLKTPGQRRTAKAFRHYDT